MDLVEKYLGEIDRNYSAYTDQSGKHGKGKRKESTWSNKYPNKGFSRKYEIREAGDGYALIGPLEPDQLYYDKGAKRVRSGASDGLWDTYEQALNHLKKIGGVLRSKEEVQKLYSKAHKASMERAKKKFGWR